MSANAKSQSRGKPVTRVLVVEDHDIVRHGYAQLLGAEPGLEICGEAADAATGMKLVFDTEPDLVLIDISLQNGHGLELCKQIRAWNEQGDRNIRMLVVSAHDEELYAERALHSGASGYLNKGETAQRLLQAIRRVLRGRVYLSQTITDRVLTRLMTGHYEDSQSPIETLSDRELEVLELIGKGLTTREVADNLHLSPKTVETYRENLKQKLNLQNANQLVRAAVQFVLEEL